MFCPQCGKSIPDGSVFCNLCGKSTSSPVVVKNTNSLETLWKVFAAIVIIIGAVFVFAYLYFHSTLSPNNTPPASSNRIGAILPAPVTEKIFSGELVIKAGQYRFWTLTISPEMRNAHVIGSFHAIGGSGNDIQAVLTNSTEFENWKNGHTAKVYYSSDKTTNGDFNVRLGTGTYILAFSNAFSLLADKQVSAEIELHYLR